jgi:hypothetical protein
VDDVDVGKPRLPWTAAGDGVGRATTFGSDRRAPGRGRRSWARGAAVGGGTVAGRRRRNGGGAATSDRQRAGGRGQHGGTGRGHGVESGERNRKEEERSTTVVISNNSRRSSGVADESYLIAVGCTRADGS